VLITLSNYKRREIMALAGLVVLIFIILATITIIVGFRAMKNAVSHKKFLEGE
jgi:hypothetical protein